MAAVERLGGYDLKVGVTVNLIVDKLWYFI